MQNFGVTDLRIVAPEPGALAPPFDAADEYDRAIHPRKWARALLSDEAHKFAVHADWLLRDARRCATADEALADVAFVAATTARPERLCPSRTSEPRPRFCDVTRRTEPRWRSCSATRRRG